MSDLKSAAATPATPGQKMITELKVSGHLMALDAGLFCIFLAPGSPVPDNATGLPGVRVSLPSGPAFKPESITISTFREDGWLGGANGAALVRVLRGPAQLLVTIYQAPNATGEAPRLQILRLSEGAAQMTQTPAQAQRTQPARAPAQQAAPAAAAPALPAGKAALPAPATAPPTNAPNVPQNTPAGGGQISAEAASQAEIVAHVQGRADVLAKLGEWMGEPGSKRWIEGFAIAPKTVIGGADIEYQAVLGRGWLSPWAEGGQYCGSRGMSLPILGLRVRLRGEAADRFDCAVTASFTDGTKVGPLDNGEPCQSESLAPLEAFQLNIVPRGAAAASPGRGAPRESAAPARTAAPKSAAKPAKPAPEPAPKARAAAVKPAPVAAKGRAAAAPAPKAKPAAAPKGGTRGRR